MTNREREREMEHQMDEGAMVTTESVHRKNEEPGVDGKPVLSYTSVPGQ